MSARVLVVDDFAPNRALLEAHLTAEYFEVVAATNGPDALAIAQRGDCDIVLLDVMMPGMDGFEVCRRLKRDPTTHHIPIVLVTALDQPADRVRGLEAGAEDFLTKPIDDIALIARVRSLSRLKVVLDELRTRAAASATLGMPDPVAAAIRSDVSGSRILVIEDRPAAARQIATTLSAAHLVDVESDPQEALFKGAEGHYDLFVVSLGLQGHDGLRLLLAIPLARADPASADSHCRRDRGQTPPVAWARPWRQRLRAASARPKRAHRPRPHAAAPQALRRHLRDNVQASIEMAIVDTLTGLHNRRYFNTNFSALMDQAARRGRSLSLMILDIDHFKLVNDTHGHDAGDHILKTFAARVRNVVRASDLICRLGGEEFAVLMPDTDLQIGETIAERVRATIGSNLFTLSPGRPPIVVTVSIGLAERGSDIEPDTLMRRADAALYRSKGSGRNRVTADAA